MKTILITGAGGFLGRYLIEALVSESRYKILAFDLTTELLKKRFTQFEQIEFYENADFLNKNIPFDQVNLIIHCAFSRSSEGKALAGSLDFTKKMLLASEQHNIQSFINISSRCVYGQNPDTPWTEQTIVYPDSMYALAKYSSELMTNQIASTTDLNCTNIRLAGLNSPGLDERITSIFIKKIIDRQPIKIIGGKQNFSFLDIRDAANGIVALINNSNPEEWQDIYNFGPPHTHSIIELADMIAEASKNYVKHKVNIEIERTNVELFAQMDSSLFYQITGWRPQYDMRAIIRSIFEYQMSQNG